jgi:NTE family protein
MVGASVGAVILAFYAGVGMDVGTLKNFGLNLTSRHLLAWAWMRRAPEALRRRFLHRAGVIPESLDRLDRSSNGALHHGVERIGVVAYDLVAGEEVFFHNLLPGFSLGDSTRGSAAIPRVYPPRSCQFNGRQMRLIDGGVSNPLPIEYLFAPPFRPLQILAVDVSKRERGRRANLEKVATLRQQHPGVPIVVVQAETLGRGTLLYRQNELERLIECGKRAAAAALRISGRTLA